ncbi:MAG TPA: hypothetical protein VMZ90_04765 [Vicinamibacterales bacterium]|nr:hypothetical protein [Vicinamibacterales bacterium]
MTHMKILASLTGVALLAVACGGSHEEAGDLQAQKAQLEREVEGLRQSAALLSKGESLIPASDVVVAIHEALVQGLIARRLPIDIVAAPYRMGLTGVEVGFKGAPTVQLRGMVTRDGLPGISVAVKLIGALSGIEVDTTTFTLRARIAADHLDIESTAGVGALFSGSSLHDVAEMLRLQLVAQLPIVEIPVRVQEDILIPAVTDGAVQLAAVRFPVKASVSRVFAANGRLWIGLHVEVTRAGKGTP